LTGTALGRGFDLLRRCDYIGHMQTTLRDAKARLSALVDMAAGGEDVVITVRGKPRVRLSAIAPEAIPDPSLWARRLRDARAKYSAGVRDTSGRILDEARGDRL
jgi:prevent-host-death family protein